MTFRKVKNIIIEGCVETLPECIMAEERGADRLELCADLAHDGLTPSKALIMEVGSKVNIPVKVMIRPRKGNFVYSEPEIKEMEESILFCKEAGVFGVVFGVLTPEHGLDIGRIEQLTALAKPLNVTIHKAIDDVVDPIGDLEKLSRIPGVDAVLTSGKRPTALEGSDRLRQMIEIGGNKVKVIVAGKVSNENIDQLHQRIGAEEYHGRKIVGDLV